MQLERLVAYFSSSPAVRLLRAVQAAEIVYFLHEQFKGSGQITCRHSELVARLTAYQEQLQSSGTEALRDRAESYLNAWCSGDSRWLVRRMEAGVNEPVYELSPHSEDVLKFLSDVLERGPGFVGTESRLKRIIETLSTLVIRGSDDPQRRLEHLRGERDRIDAEIAAIETEGVVPTYTPTAIRERFSEAVADLIQLQGDFRAVEESFKQITRDVQRRQTQRQGTRGQILGYALDAEDALRGQDQGVSFHEFVRLVLSPSKQEELEEIIARLDQIVELSDQADGLRRIHGMVPSLLAEAQKVLRTTQRLSTTLRRLLDTRATAGRQRLAELLAEIRQAAVELAESPPRDECGVEVETDLDIHSVSERTFWTPPARFDATELANQPPDEDDRLAAFKSLALMRRLDWSHMRRSITASLATRESISLSQLLDDHPPDSGVVEILGYMQIAHDDGHDVDPAKTETIFLSGNASPLAIDNGLDRVLRRSGLRRRSDRTGALALEVPQVTFRLAHARGASRANSRPPGRGSERESGQANLDERPGGRGEANGENQ